MKKLAIVILIGILLTGCGTGVNNESNGSNENTNGSGMVSGEGSSSIVEKNPLHYEYIVKNETEEVVKLEFTSSQRFDYSVRTKDGKEIFLFSSIAAFLQALGEEELKQGEELVYEIDLTDLNLEKGEYILSVWMTPKDGEKYKVSKDIVIK